MTVNFICLLPSTNLLPRDETLLHLAVIIILKIFKDFFACKLVIAANHQHPEKIQTSSLATSIPEAAIIQQAVFQPQPAIIKQPAAPTNSKNQQQQPETATSNSNQQQQPATATSNSNQQQQPAFIHQPALTQPPAAVLLTSARPTPASVSYHYGS